MASQVQSNMARTARVDRVTDQDQSAVDDLLDEGQDRRQGSTSPHSEGHGAELRHQSEASRKTPSSPSIADARSALSEKPSSHADSRPVVLPAQTRGGQESDEDEDDVDSDFDIHGFAHPSTYTEQLWIWVPRDELGISKVLVRELRQSGVDASDEGASIDTGGTVEVQRAPPDEDWSGGHDA